ncbi:MAG TPA: hypothetical protein VG295_15415 [Solirubrobacteraceae bacterium]|nr:hypothetical protein [Solirubrobacteraceae bacterium]
MGFDAGRIRRGEIVAGGGGVLLLAGLFVLPWYAVRGPAGELRLLDGWQALTTTRWVLLVTIAAALALVFLTASRRSPALPVVASMLSCLLGGLSTVLLLFRVIDHPGLSARAGIYIGFVAALAIGYGAYLALRTEGSWFGDPGSIKTVSPRSPEPTSAGRPGP